MKLTPEDKERLRRVLEQVDQNVAAERQLLARAGLGAGGRDARDPVPAANLSRERLDELDRRMRECLVCVPWTPETREPETESRS